MDCVEMNLTDVQCKHTKIIFDVKSFKILNSKILHLYFDIFLVSETNPESEQI